LILIGSKWKAESLLIDYKKIKIVRTSLIMIEKEYVATMKIDGWIDR